MKPRPERLFTQIDVMVNGVNLVYRGENAHDALTTALEATSAAKHVRIAVTSIYRDGTDRRREYDITQVELVPVP